MVCGIGVDLVDVGRMERLRRRWRDRFLKRVFTKTELETCLASARADERLAARFAAKEAFLKALGTGLSVGIRWREIEIRSNPRGAPSMRISGSAAGLMRSRGAETAHLSISHTPTAAVAVVVLEG